MNTVITSAEAKKITGGRPPLAIMPLQQALEKIDECMNIDEARFFSDKADALAAWGKVYRDDAVGRRARILKLFAYRA